MCIPNVIPPFTFLVAELDAPTAELVEALQRVNQVPVKGVTSHLAVGDHVDSGQLLRLDCLVDGPVLETLELRHGEF
jgi:hypothetical protein